MKSAKELVDGLKAILGKDTEVIPAVVKSIDKAAFTCDVEFDELEIGEVRLKATNEDKTGFKVFPKVDSVVLIQKLGEKEEYFVAMYSEIDEVLIENDDCTLHINDKVLLKKGTVSIEISDKVLIESGGDTMKQILTLLTEAVQSIVVLQGKNADPVKLLQAQTKINNLLS